MSNLKSKIWITFRREGTHKYPAALTDPKLKTGDEYLRAAVMRHVS